MATLLRAMTGSWVLLPSLSSTTRVQPKDCPHTAQATCRNLEYNGTESNDACPMRQNARASRHTFLFPVPWLFSPRFHPRDVDSRTVENAYSDKLHGQGCRMKFSDEALNPLNLMPDISNAPTHGLSTSRVESSIPKTGGDKSRRVVDSLFDLVGFRAYKTGCIDGEFSASRKRKRLDRLGSGFSRNCYCELC